MARRPPREHKKPFAHHKPTVHTPSTPTIHPLTPTIQPAHRLTGQPAPHVRPTSIRRYGRTGFIGAIISFVIVIIIIIVLLNVL